LNPYFLKNFRDTYRFQFLGPGLLIAATGVGAGDLATAALAGIHVGIDILWVVVLGAAIKFVLNNKLAQYQIHTGDTLLKGMLTHLPSYIRYVLVIYFLIWSFLVAVALMSVCGIVGYAILPLGFTPTQGKIVFGIVQSLIGWALIYKGGYPIFEKIMRVAILGMLITILITALKMPVSLKEVVTGIFVPKIPTASDQLGWTLALMGGVGGTVTVLNYNYWLRETRRDNPASQTNNMWDLVVGYLITAIFSLAMVIIGHQVMVEGKGATLIVKIAEKLETTLSPSFKWIFLIGAWATVFSSLLGVWQGVPYLFEESWYQLKKQSAPESNMTQGLIYRYYLAGIAILPIMGLWIGFAYMQKFYAVTGALFIPILAATLLYLPHKDNRLQPGFSPLLSKILLWAIFIFFIYMAQLSIT